MKENKSVPHDLIKDKSNPLAKNKTQAKIKMFQVGVTPLGTGLLTFSDFECYLKPETAKPDGYGNADFR